MPLPRRKQQAGYALILMVLGLMGVGGLVAASFTQDVKKEAEKERYLHNQRVLAEAKQALLQYTYNYPQFNAEGPGRLPCPDDDNDGLTGALSAALCTSVGRLPWNEPELNFYDARDASNERLWYAVSDAFYNLGGGPIVNSDSLGSITIQDRSGAIMYDGTAAGIAAIIIAPGPPIERNGVMQDRTADENDPDNYLDVIGGADNADFVNNTNNGFIVGPIDDLVTGTVMVNDQVIVITADEVIEAAEKATLQAYRETIRDYSDRIENDLVAPPAPWTRYYPWLFNYQVTDIDAYPSNPVFATERANSLTNIGRVPSIYANYFTETTSQPVESELDFNFSLDYPVTPTTVGYDQLTPAVASGTFVFNAGASHQFNSTTLPQIISFSDIADVVGNDGRLTATPIANQTFEVHRWFWDESEFGPPSGIWTICPNGGDQLSDCNRDNTGIPTPGSATNEGGIEALHVIAELDFSAPVDFDFDFSTAPVISVTATASAGGHAMIQAVFAGGDVIDIPVTLSYEIDRFYEASFDIQETGTLVVSDLNFGNTTLGLRYYPELPAWIFANDWHRSVQMAYAAPYLPDQIAAPTDCVEGTNCVELVGFAGNEDNKKSLLVIAGEHDWVDGDAAPQPADAPDTFFNDEVDDLFNPENADLDRIYDIRTVADPLALGDSELDRILVVDEL